MIKRLTYTTLLSALLCGAASCTESEVFYATTYDVVRVEAVVTLENPAADGTEEDPQAAAIRQEVLAAAPVGAGGGYALDYIRHDSGMLEVHTGYDGAVLQGAFLRTPGTDRILFVYADTPYDYTISDYTDDAGASRVLFIADFTEQYRIRYPFLKIKQVLRQEYTAHEI